MRPEDKIASAIARQHNAYCEKEIRLAMDALFPGKWEATEAWISENGLRMQFRLNGIRDVVFGERVVLTLYPPEIRTDAQGPAQVTWPNALRLYDSEAKPDA